MAVPTLGGDPTTWGPALNLYLQEIEARFAEAEQPNSPKPAFRCLEAALPAASSFSGCVLIVTDLNVWAYSDGSDWIRTDTGVAI